MANEKLVIGQFMAKREKNPDSPNSPFAPGGDVSVEKDFLEADIQKNLTPQLPAAPAGPGPLPKQPAPALSKPAEVPFQPAPKAHLPAEIPFRPAPPLTPTTIAAQQPPLPTVLSAPPANGPASTANPAGHVPAAGPASSANPVGHIPAAGPNSSANPAPYSPPAGPASSANPAPHSPAAGPSSSANPPDHVPTEKIKPDDKLDYTRHEAAGLSALPSDVKIPSQPQGGHTGLPTKDLISQKAKIDANVKAIYKQLDKDGKYASITGFPVNTQGDLLLDPTLYAKQLARLGSMVGRGGLHAATQVGLFLMNRRGKIWNPLSVAPVPATELLVPVMIDVPESNEIVDHGKIFDAAIKESDPLAPVTKDKLKKIFSPAGGTIGAVVNSVTSLIGGKTGDEFVNRTDPLKKSSFVNGVVPVRFNKNEKNGFFKLSKGKQTPIDDDEAYVPMSFTDLRPIGNQYRMVYFRPFITSLSEDFSPEWNTQSYFGRVDRVASYQSTGRSVNLGFQLVTFTPQDVPAIYQKLTWLSSMVYPEYDKDLLFKSGPVVRMRVGNLIDGIGPGGRGLPGIITALSYDYSDSIWELKKNLKVPRTVNVNLSFQVLHDRPIGRGENGKFGGLGDFDAEGNFKLPNGNDAFSAGGDSTKSAKVVKGHQSFRAIDDKFDPNDYT